jgi:hypothetical protein
MVTVSPRSIASSRSEKFREASVAVIVRIHQVYLIIRFRQLAYSYPDATRHLTISTLLLP